MTLLLLAYFAAGVLRDGMSIFYYRAISNRRALSVSLWAGGITLYDLLVLATLLTKWNLLLAISYAVGCAAGSFMALRRSK
jgi:hypothetical protein